MTWLGKILTFVVMLAAVVAAYFSAQAYVTRSNWKLEADKYKAAYKDAVAARESEFRRYQSSEDSLKRLLAVEQGKSRDLEKANKRLTDDATKSAADFMNLQTRYTDADSKSMIRDAITGRTLTELDAVRTRNSTLEDNSVKLLIDVENAKKNEVRANNEAKLAKAIAEDNAKKVEELLVRNAELRASGGDPRRAVLGSLDKQPPPVLANLRGEVNRVLGDQLELSIGLDAGLAVGTVLDIYRTEGGGRYLGTVKVTSAANLYPKQAIVTFIPARGNIGLDRLKPEELPRKGDEVRPPQAISGGGP